MSTMIAAMMAWHLAPMMVRHLAPMIARHLVPMKTALCTLGSDKDDATLALRW